MMHSCLFCLECWIAFMLQCSIFQSYILVKICRSYLEVSWHTYQIKYQSVWILSINEYQNEYFIAFVFLNWFLFVFQPVEATDDAFWDQFWADTATSVQDVFALVPAAEIRAVREESPSNLATLCYKARLKFFCFF